MDIENIILEVEAPLGNDNGHDVDHVARVRNLATSFARQEGADLHTVELASLCCMMLLTARYSAKIRLKV